ncbi:hypothetical protein BN381_360036 [Candidatus Microthrix parvicella RN1]|uniref:Uncharacterized protein n=1 Tax=Candidatus Neomicrothrix parvicella RN1 TaxID=1229780 RepID=R4Z0C7_9ACTN|nr:hypothetical protein BN381_360036 [Candidatus Microthrix parvicella RN1]
MALRNAAKVGYLSQTGVTQGAPMMTRRQYQ